MRCKRTCDKSKTLTEQPTAEKRARVERLLAQLKGIALEQITFPAGVLPGPEQGVRFAELALQRYRRPTGVEVEPAQKEDTAVPAA